MLTADAKQGDIVSLVARIRQTGACVVYLGYLRIPDMDSPIESCKDLLLCSSQLASPYLGCVDSRDRPRVHLFGGYGRLG